jgi:hypothetical protein
VPTFATNSSRVKGSNRRVWDACCTSG